MAAAVTAAVSFPSSTNKSTSLPSRTSLISTPRISLKKVQQFDQIILIAIYMCVCVFVCDDDVGININVIVVGNGRFNCIEVEWCQ